MQSYWEESVKDYYDIFIWETEFSSDPYKYREHQRPKKVVAGDKVKKKRGRPRKKVKE